MASYAMGFENIYCGQSNAPKNIHPIFNCFEMFGIYTSFIPAKMVYDQTFWYISLGITIGVSMSAFLGSLIEK